MNDQDVRRLIAATSVCEELGAIRLGVGFDLDESEGDWWAYVEFEDHSPVAVVGYESPGAALHGLTVVVLCQAKCLKCERPIALDRPRGRTKRCWWRYRDDEWQAGCTNHPVETRETE